MTDTAIPTMNEKFTALVTGNLATDINSLRLGVMDRRNARIAGTSYSPLITIRYYVLITSE